MIHLLNPVPEMPYSSEIAGMGPIPLIEDLIKVEEGRAEHA